MQTLIIIRLEVRIVNIVYPILWSNSHNSSIFALIYKLHKAFSNKLRSKNSLSQLLDQTYKMKSV